MVSGFVSQNVNRSLNFVFSCLVADSIRLLDADLLSPLMCITIGVLFSIIQVVRVWFGILVSAAGFINNRSTLKDSVAGLQNETV